MSLCLCGFLKAGILKAGAKVIRKSNNKKAIIFANTKSTIMAFFPLSILALAAGIHLLIKVKREYLGGIYPVFAWLVVALSLLAIGFGGFRAIQHHRHEMCHDGGKCTMEKEIVIKDGKMDGSTCCHMNGCHMEGDSIVMDNATAEKMMGKEACDKMCKERGRCIMSKDECMKMCADGGSKCGMGDEGKAGCCKHDKEEKMECCKKKM